ncbi:MAG: ABC transporter permease, partial [Desulfosporosinus sp.]
FKVAPSYALPSPITVFNTFIKKLTSTVPDGATLFENLAASLSVALSGFMLGVVIGVPLGIAMAWYKKVDLIARPLFDLLRPIPPLAWIPVMILLVGIGTMAKASVIFVSSFIPCVVNSYTGIKQTSQVHLWVGQTFGANNFELLRKIAIPTALPNVFTGIRVSLGNSWVTLVAAEMLASTRGLGYMIQLGRTVARTDIIIVGMLTIGAVGALLAFILQKIENNLVRGGRRN